MKELAGFGKATPTPTTLQERPRGLHARFNSKRYALTTGSAASAPSAENVSRFPTEAEVLFTRVTETPARCPFDGAQQLSTKETDYQPWQGAPFDLKTGLQPLEDPDDLYEIDEHYLEELEERAQLLQRMRSEVLASTPEASHAETELLQTLADVLPRKYPDRFRVEGSTIYNRATGEEFDLAAPGLNALEAAALLVQEDLALMKLDERSKQYKLVSGAVMFPMRWNLLQKMNRRLNVIHGPVPFYQKNLRHPVDQFMESLTPEQPFWRANYGITDQPALFQALTEKQILAAKSNSLESIRRDHITAEEAPDKLFVRCERQTLSRLPASKAVLFTIRTYVRPLREYLNKPRPTLGRLRESVAAMPEIWVNYKTMQGVKDLALEVLDRHLAADAEAGSA